MTNSTGKISTGDLSKIRKRHDNIPQDGLFDELPVTNKTGEIRRKSVRSIAWALCPECKSGLVGLIAVTADAVQFRDHNRKVGRITLPCSGSGQLWEGERFDSPKAAH